MRYLPLVTLLVSCASQPSTEVVQTKDGVSVTSLKQRVREVPILGAERKQVLDKQGNVIATFGSLASPTAIAEAEKATFDLRDDDAAAKAALTAAKLHEAIAVTPAPCTEPYRCFTPNTSDAFVRNEMRFPVHVRQKQVFFRSGERLEPAYYNEVDTIELDTRTRSLVGVIVSARTGKTLLRHEMTERETYRVWADPATKHPYASAYGNVTLPAPPSARQSSLAPAPVAQEDVTLENVPFSQNDPWLPPGATTLNGNNARAYGDIEQPDGLSPGDIVATRTGPEEFLRTYTFGEAPTNPENVRAAQTHGFYVINFLHDWFYDAGWNEARGNAQAFNYGRGGLGGDPILFETVDASGRNNANASTPADGSSPRIQMFLFDGPASLTGVSGIVGNLSTESGGFGDKDYDVTGTLIAAPGPTGQLCTEVDANTFAGGIAFVNRGGCNFTVKALNAQNAGAIALLIANNAPGAGPNVVGGTDAAVTIPVQSISYEDGQAIRAVDGPVVVRMSRVPAGDLDAALDTSIIAHEWGHVLSNRLIGDGIGLYQNQARSLGEGWGDIVALLVSVRPGDSADNWSGAFPVAQFSSPGYGGQYFGFRRMPYSTDMTINSLTLKHIQEGVPLPTGAPHLPFPMNAEVHNSGEVWAEMVWNCYASLLREHPFEEAQDRMKAYLVTALAATPVNPTFIEARDAMIAAATAHNADDGQLFRAAFAARGAGAGAEAPPRESGDHLFVAESYSTTTGLKVDIRLEDSCDGDGVMDVGEPSTLVVTMTNVGWSEISPTTLTLVPSGDHAFTFADGATINTGTLAIGAKAERRVPVTLVTPDDTEVTFTTTPRIGPEFAGATFPLNADLVASNTDYFHDLSAWTQLGDGGWSVRQGVAHVADAPTESVTALVSPPLTLGADPVVALIYRHSFETSDDGEYFDGAVLQYTAGDNQWHDIMEITDDVPYSGYLEPGNPLGPVPAMVSLSEGFPSMTLLAMALHPEMAGQTIQIRIVVASDGGVGAHGFDLDAFQVAPVARNAFRALDEESDTSCGPSPLAKAGYDQHVNEGVMVTLDASDSLAASGTLSFGWVQIGGPPVALSSATGAVATFTTPLVDGDTVLAFELTATAGSKSATDVMLVLVNPPELVVTAPTGVDEGASLTMGATGSTGANGETLTFTWAQTAGPSVVIAPSGESVTFTAPNVETDTTLTFHVTASDGIGTDATDVNVTVRNVDTPTGNRAPVLSEFAQLAAAADAVVQLTGLTVSDPDGDAVTLLWTQVGGPAVTLDDNTAAAPSFTAPRVAVDTLVAWEVVATDANGATASRIARVNVTGTGEVPPPHDHDDDDKDGGGCNATPLSAWLPLAAVFMLGRKRRQATRLAR